jgi:hypothetical protein
MSIASLTGIRPGGTHDDTVERVTAGGHTDQMLPTLRAIRRRLAFGGDTTAFTDRLLRHHWASRDPHAAATHDAEQVTAACARLSAAGHRPT